MTEHDTPLVSQSCNEEEFARQSEKTLQGVGIDEMLANQETTYLEYMGPCPAVDSSGARYDACVITVVSVKDAIGLARVASAARRVGKFGTVAMPDREMLEDFIVVHWAGPSARLIAKV